MIAGVFGYITARVINHKNSWAVNGPKSFLQHLCIFFFYVEIVDSKLIYSIRMRPVRSKQISLSAHLI